jgi:hypothetical protein
MRVTDETFTPGQMIFVVRGCRRVGVSAFTVHSYEPGSGYVVAKALGGRRRATMVELDRVYRTVEEADRVANAARALLAENP